MKPSQRNPIETPVPDISGKLDSCREIVGKLSSLGFDAEAKNLTYLVDVMEETHKEYIRDRDEWGLILHSISGFRYRTPLIAIFCIVGTIVAMKMF